MLNNCLPVTASVEFALISPSLRLVIFVPPISIPLLLIVTVSPAVIVSPFTVVAFTVLALLECPPPIAAPHALASLLMPPAIVDSAPYV